MELESLLISQNPWWNRDFNINQLPEYKLSRRFSFDNFSKYLNETSLMIFLKGMRRMGKSTLMKQMVIDLIEKQKVNPNDIYFIEFSQTFNDLPKVLQYIESGSFVFLDEIQYCENWRNSLKEYYDLAKAKRIIFSGSATLGFTKEKESLLGRFIPIQLNPLTFREYLYLKYGKDFNKAYRNSIEWQTYMFYGEFPELLKMGSNDLKYIYLRNSVIEPLVTMDISFYNVEKKTEFLNFLKTLAANVAQVINKSNISAEVGISRPSVDRYLAVLQDIGVVKLVPNYYKSARQVISSDKKVFFSSANLALALLSIKSLEGPETAQFSGHIFENAVYNQISSSFEEIFYWKRKQKEIDFVVKDSNFLRCIEVKHKNNINNAEYLFYKRSSENIGAKSFNIVYNGESNLREGLVNPVNLDEALV